MGPTLTHKSEICRKLFLEGKSVEQVCRETCHSPGAVNRYITDFKRVLQCRLKGLSVEETAFAVKMSKPLVEQYHNLFAEYAQHNPKLEELLNHHPKLKPASTNRTPAPYRTHALILVYHAALP